MRLLQLAESLFPLAMLLVLAPATTAAPANTPSAPVTQRQETESSSDGSSSTKGSSESVLLRQLENPVGILAVLLIIGGDIVQKAVAQSAGMPIFNIPWESIPITRSRRVKDFQILKKIPVFSVTPVAFSLGWVAFAFNSTLAALGDGILMPKPENTVYVIDLKTGTTKTNESWTLGRLVRDLELKTTRLARGKNCVTFHYSNYETFTLKSPKRMRDWFFFGIILAGQFVIAAIPQWRHGRWLVLQLTAVGTSLAIITAALPQWSKERYDAGENDRSYILTRGNGHQHSFVFLHRNNRNYGSNINLEHLAVIRPDLVSSNLTRFTMPLLTLCWIFLLIEMSGVGEDTWNMLGVGLLGMSQNLYVANWDRSPKAHGIPLEEDRYNRIVENTTMDAIKKAEQNYPWVGLRLKDVYFRTTELRPSEKTVWDEFERTVHERATRFWNQDKTLTVYSPPRPAPDDISLDNTG